MFQYSRRSQLRRRWRGKIQREAYRGTAQRKSKMVALVIRESVVSWNSSDWLLVLWIWSVCSYLDGLNIPVSVLLLVHTQRKHQEPAKTVDDQEMIKLQTNQVVISITLSSSFKEYVEDVPWVYMASFHILVQNFGTKMLQVLYPSEALAFVSFSHSYWCSILCIINIGCYYFASD